MGVKLYSKIESKQWPHITALTNKIERAFNAYISNKDITEFSFKKPIGGFLQSNRQSIDRPIPSTSHAQTRCFSSDDHTNRRAITARDEEERLKVEVQGRQIQYAECEFVFKKVWNAHCNCENDEKKEGEHDHYHKPDSEEIYLKDLFDIIHYSAVMLNKADPDNDCDKPYQQFQKYAYKMDIPTADGKTTHIEFVDKADVPKILFMVFIG